MNAFQRFEYVSLRLLRRFAFNERIAHRFVRWLPYYAPSVNEAEPMRIARGYASALESAGIFLARQRVLEVGAGRTNVVGYALASMGAAAVTLLEPFVPFDARRDTVLRKSALASAAIDADLVHRISSFADVADSSIDVLMSNSVLEHVLDLRSFLTNCRRVLATDGVMLHQVDYRDHFFKYPYAFLTFNEQTWSRWLDPGDLPRWRLPDHLAEFAAVGFAVEVLARESAAEAFARIEAQLVGRFATGAPGIDVTSATLLAKVPT